MPVTTRATAQYSTVQIASEAMMPMGMSRCGFLVSSAVVATTSKPMYAKKTRAAPAKMPPTPNAVGSMPERNCSSGWLSPDGASLGAAGGTNGDQLAGSMNRMPATMTNRTMKIFTATSTMLTRSDSLMPNVMRPPRTTTSRIAMRSTVPP